MPSYLDGQYLAADDVAAREAADRAQANAGKAAPLTPAARKALEDTVIYGGPNDTVVRDLLAADAARRRSRTTPILAVAGVGIALLVSWSLLTRKKAH